MKKQTKRLIAMLLALVMTLNLGMVTVFAEEGEEAVAGEFAMLADAVAREVAAGIFLYIT